jgi:hypothetical protein
MYCTNHELRLAVTICEKYRAIKNSPKRGQLYFHKTHPVVQDLPHFLPSYIEFDLFITFMPLVDIFKGS